MCVNYVHYYPQTQLELCKSAVDPGFLQKYFHMANRLVLAMAWSQGRISQKHLLDSCTKAEFTWQSNLCVP